MNNIEILNKSKIIAIDFPEGAPPTKAQRYKRNAQNWLPLAVSVSLLAVSVGFIIAGAVLMSREPSTCFQALGRPSFCDISAKYLVIGVGSIFFTATASIALLARAHRNQKILNVLSTPFHGDEEKFVHTFNAIKRSVYRSDTDSLLGEAEKKMHALMQDRLNALTVEKMETHNLEDMLNSKSPYLFRDYLFRQCTVDWTHQSANVQASAKRMQDYLQNGFYIDY